MKYILPCQRRHDLIIHGTGRIDIAARIARKLGLRHGDVVSVASEGEETYLCISHRAENAVGRYDGRCFCTSRNGKGTWRTYSKRLATALMRKARTAPDAQTLRLPLGEEKIVNGSIYIPIIIYNKL